MSSLRAQLRIALRIEEQNRNTHEYSLALALPAGDNEAEGKWQPGDMRMAPDATLDYARKCAPKLKYYSSWKGGYYIKEGQMIAIPTYSTVAYRTALCQQWAGRGHTL